MDGELWQLADADLMSETLEVCAQIHRLQVRRVMQVIELDERGVLAERGYRTVAQWLAASTNLEIGECTAIVSLAALLRLEPEVRAAYERGDLDAVKARQIAYFCRHYPDAMDPRQLATARDILITHASATAATRETVRAVIRRLERRFGRDDAVPAGEDITRNEVFASKSLHGRVVVKADLDAVTGARLLHILSGLSAPHPRIDGIRDERTPARRRADGFAEMLRRYEAAGLGPVEGGVKPHLSVTASIRDLTNAESLRALFAHTGEDGYALEPWAGPLSIDAARMLACDAVVSRIVVDDHGVPLAHGRAHRTATAAQRRALAIRDGGCAFPSCATPAAWTDAHHIEHWLDGGATDLDNLVLLCGHHHRLMHHTGWEVRVGPDRRPEFLPPPEVDLHRTPIPGNSSRTAA